MDTSLVVQCIITEKQSNLIKKGKGSKIVRAKENLRMRYGKP